MNGFLYLATKSICDVRTRISQTSWNGCDPPLGWISGLTKRKSIAASPRNHLDCMAIHPSEISCPVRTPVDKVDQSKNRSELSDLIQLGITSLPEKLIPNGLIEPNQSDRAFRRRALIRSWFCPGAGFALLGLRGFGLLTFLASFGMLPAIIWIALQPIAAAAWTALGILVVALTLSLTEQFACKWGT